METGKRITATFGDLRPRRYHAGVDISTNGGIGYPIYAADNGYIERVLVGTKGYGKAIYLRLRDKRVVVYAHLQIFSASLNKYIRSQQDKRNRYALELRFKPTDFPIRKGDYLGLTGDTGSISGPHLHFELRDPQNRPLNPLTNGFEIADDAPPEIAALAVIPLAPETIAHGSPLTSVIPVRRTRAGWYVLDDTIAVSGPFGLAVKAYDRLPGIRYQQTLHGLSLTIDGVQHYSIQFDRYEFSEGRLSEVERDYRLYRLNRDDFHHLYTTPHTGSLSFVRSGSKGPIELEPGYHPFAIKVWDKESNVAVLKGVLAHTPPTELNAAAEWSDDDDGWIVTLDASTPLRQYHVFFFNIRGHQEDTFSYRVPPNMGKRVQFLVPRSQGRRRILQIIGIDQWGAKLAPVHLSLIPIDDVTRQRQFTLHTEHSEKAVIFQVSSDFYLPFAPEILLRNKDKVSRFSTQAVSPVDFLSPPFYLAQLEGLEEIIVRVVGLKPSYEVRIPITGLVVPPGQRKQLSDKEGHVLVEFLPGTFYDSTFVWLNSADIPQPEDGAFILRPVEIEPYTRPFAAPMGIQIKVPVNQVLPGHAGIFYLDRRNGWEFMKPAGSLDQENLIKTRTYRTLATSGEVFALIEELSPPVIEFWTPDQGGTYASYDLSRIRLKVSDAMAGIADENAISVLLDGVPLIFEYNTYRETVSYELSGFLPPGEHQLQVSAIDQVGNRATKTITFMVR